MGKNKTRQQSNVLKNSLEAIQGYSGDVAKSVVKTAVTETDDLFADLLGLNSSAEKSHEQQKDNGETVLFNRSQEKKSEVHARGHIEYHDEIRKSGERANKSETRQMTQQVHEILAELQRLIKSSKAMEMEFAEIAVIDTPQEVKNYDLNFFEWMLLVIKQAREKVEDSGAWLSAVKGKNSKKGGGYWDMFKKHGTSFGMSSERSTATSVG